jgi:hypothetical protein
MNRIEELKINAGLNDNPDQEGLDLFAAMIINECMDVVRQHTLKHSGLPKSFDGKIFVCEEIKEHFNK